VAYRQATRLEPALHRTLPPWRRADATSDVRSCEGAGVRGAPRTLRLAFIESVAILLDEYDSAISFVVNAFGFELVEDSPALTKASVASTTAAPTDARVVALVATRLLGHQNRGLVGESG
jgi:hypothetical protein